MAFPNVRVHQNHLEGLLKHTPSSSDSIGPGLGLKMCISNKFPGDAKAAGPRNTLKNRGLDDLCFSLILRFTHRP